MIQVNAYTNHRHYTKPYARAIWQEPHNSQLKANQLSIRKPKNPLLHVAGKSKSKEVIDWVFSQNPDIKQANEYGYTPVFMAEGPMLDELLRRGANLEARNDMERTPVFTASGKKLATLLKHGVRVDVRDDQGNTPFIYHAASLQIIPTTTLSNLE